MATLGAVLLAAGSSERFGTDNKLLTKIDGQPMVRVVANAVVGAGCIDEVAVVIGHDAAAIEEALHGLNVRFVFNENWREGIGGSIALGVSSLSVAPAGVAIVPGDMPFLTESLISRLGARFDERRGGSIVFPATPSGEQRNPVLWPRRFFSLLEGLSGPGGGKRLLSERVDSSSPVFVEDDRVLVDIDRPGDVDGV